MSRHPIEVLLPHRSSSGPVGGPVATAAIAVAALGFDDAPGVAAVAAAVLTTLRLIRGRQAWRVIRYQRNMRKLPSTGCVQARSLSRRKAVLGKGFRWTNNTPNDCAIRIRSEVQHYVQPGRLHRWARRQEGGLESTPILQWLATCCPRGLVESSGAAAGSRWQAGTACRGARRAGGLDGHR